MPYQQWRQSFERESQLFAQKYGVSIDNARRLQFLTTHEGRVVFGLSAVVFTVTFICLDKAVSFAKKWSSAGKDKEPTPEGDATVV